MPIYGREKRVSKNFLRYHPYLQRQNSDEETDVVREVKKTSSAKKATCKIKKPKPTKTPAKKKQPAKPKKPCNEPEPVDESTQSGSEEEPMKENETPEAENQENFHGVCAARKSTRGHAKKHSTESADEAASAEGAVSMSSQSIVAKNSEHEEVNLYTDSFKGGQISIDGLVVDAESVTVRTCVCKGKVRRTIIMVKNGHKDTIVTENGVEIHNTKSRTSSKSASVAAAASASSTHPVEVTEPAEPAEPPADA